MSRFRWVIVVVCTVAVAPWLFPDLAGAAPPPKPDNVTVKIEGKSTFSRHGVSETFHFPDAPTKVHSGGFITFDNQTNDGHTMTLIAAADIPNSFDCKLCDQVNGVYFPNGSPAGFNIDGGFINDDASQADANAVDANGFAIEDFDTVSHSNGTDPATIGDSTLVDANGSNNQGFPTTRVVQVTAPPGTTLEYICTFHDWMHGTIKVVS